MIQVIPAILTNDLNVLRRQIDMASTFAERVQVDFALAPFIEPSSTFDPSELPRLSFSGILEAHIMTREPEQHFADIRRIGFDFVYVHLETLPDPINTFRKARAEGLKVGLAINPSTKWKSIKKKILKEVDAILFMTVIPGKQGNPFEESVLESIKQFKEKNENIVVAVDGGISKKNIKKVASAGAELIAVGSNIWRDDKGPEEAYKNLKKLVNR